MTFNEAFFIWIQKNHSLFKITMDDYLISGRINSSRRNAIWLKSRIHHIYKPWRQLVPYYPACILYITILKTVLKIPELRLLAKLFFFPWIITRLGEPCCHENNPKRATMILLRVSYFFTFVSLIKYKITCVQGWRYMLEMKNSYQKHLIIKN